MDLKPDTTETPDAPAEPTVESLCDAIGRGVIAKALGCGRTAVSNAVVKGKFPASWFEVIEALAHERGLEAPRSLFNFIEPPEERAA